MAHNTPLTAIRLLKNNRNMKTYSYFPEEVKQRNEKLHESVKTISFKIYEIIPKANGKGTKRSKGLITIVAERPDLSAAFIMAEELISRLNYGAWERIMKRYIQGKHF